MKSIIDRVKRELDRKHPTWVQLSPADARRLYDLYRSVKAKDEGLTAEAVRRLEELIPGA